MHLQNLKIPKLTPRQRRLDLIPRQPPPRPIKRKDALAQKRFPPLEPHRLDAPAFRILGHDGFEIDGIHRVNGGVEEGGELVGAAVEGEISLHGGHGGVGFESVVVFAEDVEAEVGEWVGGPGEGCAAMGADCFLAGEEGAEGFEELEEEEGGEGEGEDGRGGMVRHVDSLPYRWSLECHAEETNAIYAMLARN